MSNSPTGSRSGWAAFRGYAVAAGICCVVAGCVLLGCAQAPTTAPTAAAVAASAPSSQAAAESHAQPQSPPGEIRRDAREVAAQPPQETAADAEVEQLRARIAQLERELEVPASSSSAAELPTPAFLLELLNELDGARMYREMEKLILRREEGWSVLYEFFDAADRDHPKILTLTHDPQLVFAMLRIIARHPDETAGISRYLMQRTKEHPESFIRREIYNFVPVFLNYHRGKYPEVRKDLEEDIVYQLEKGGQYNYKVFLAMRDLDFHPPAEKLYPILHDPANVELHNPLIQYLASRKEEGLKVLVKHITEAPQPTHPSVRAALLALAGMESSGGLEALKAFLEHPNLDLRATACRAFFSYPRGRESLPYAVSFLNSAAVEKQKRVFVTLLLRRNARFLELLRAEAETVQDPAIRELLRAEPAARASKENGAPSPPEEPTQP